MRKKMKIARMLAGAGAALGLSLGLAATPAHAADEVAFYLYNAHQEKCLSASLDMAQRSPVLGTCDPINFTRIWGYNTDWMLRNIIRNQCLDTNGRDVYLSTCSSADEGQKWDRYHHTKRGLESLAFPGRVIVAWNDGKISLANPDDVDEATKYEWSWLY